MTVTTAPQSYWSKNPKAVVLAQKLWTDGLSAGQVAKEVSKEYGKISRNAVIGKLTRTGTLVQRLTREDAGPGGSFKTLTRKKKIKEAILAIDDTMPDLPVSGLTSLPYERPDTAVSLYAAKPHHCRWPVGHEHELLFCGATITPGSGLSYCPHHFRRSVPKHRERINGYRPHISRYR